MTVDTLGWGQIFVRVLWQLLPGAKALKTRSQVHLHVGTAETVADMRLLGDESGWVRFRLRDPLLLLPAFSEKEKLPSPELLFVFARFPPSPKLKLLLPTFPDIPCNIGDGATEFEFPLFPPATLATLPRRDRTLPSKFSG